MPTDGSVVGLAEELIGEHKAATDNPRKGAGRVARYLRGDHDLPYAPRGARQEYRELARKSVTNWLPLISETYVKGLFVDGFRAAKSTENARPWSYWQANRLDARQTIAHRGALDFGAAYTRVLPSAGVAPSIRPLPALDTFARYEDDGDEWPLHGIHKLRQTTGGAQLFDLYDSGAVHRLALPKDGGKLTVVSSDPHGLGVTPLVRFRDRLDGENRGIVEPLIVLQDRINEAVFSLLIALQYASFRQRWATGLAIPTVDDEDSPLYGQPVEPFQAAVDRLWVTDNHEAKFGSFDQTDVTGHLETYGSGVRTLAAIAQLSPHVLLGDLVNLSADALAAAEAATQRKIGEYETIFGESWEQTLRLAALAAGDAEAARDDSAQVRWRDTEARSMAAAVDALGKMVTMLAVPAEAAWERIPGVTDQDVVRWREMAKSSDGLTQLAAQLARRSEPAPGDAGAADANG
ncbi:Phage portal protein, SPP1 Gp6-like [Micromonospora nigra]|uniref:Phage portal protein, SPP1 Gp6-like n=1 Tax=Micromonospora nigra TaxID=145857 RepID=A0A1C6SUI8_9ACTN|nr:phage portal protein [Micromonospora nigra]SCL33039.1 Phage portal protein, SPP1 Gp6-like [Micromonospora nigra]